MQGQLQPINLALTKNKQMKKNRLIFFSSIFVIIFLIIIEVWLYIQNPLDKIYNKVYFGMILGLTAILTSIFNLLRFPKNEMMRLLFPLLVTLILIFYYLTM
jgi:hypothetical protein